MRYESPIKDKAYPYEVISPHRLQLPTFFKLSLDQGLVLTSLRKGPPLIWHAETQEVLLEGSPQQLVIDHAHRFSASSDPSGNLLPDHPHYADQTVAMTHGHGLTVKTASDQVLEWHTVAQPELHLLTDSRALVSFGAGSDHLPKVTR